MTKFTRDPKINQRIIMDNAATVLTVVLEYAIREQWTKDYLWRLKGAIRLLRNPPTKNRGMHG